MGFLFIKLAGIKVHETNEKELVMEPAVRWAGNPNITLVLKFLFLPITIQVRRAFKSFLNNNFFYNFLAISLMVSEN